MAAKKRKPKPLQQTDRPRPVNFNRTGQLNQYDADRGRISFSVSGLLTAPCGDFDKSADVDRFGEIGSHIWSTIYLTVRGRVAV